MDEVLDRDVQKGFSRHLITKSIILIEFESNTNGGVLRDKSSVLCMCVFRTRGGISCHQLVPGAVHAPGQPAVRPVEPHSRGLPAGLGSAGHLGHLRQGLGPPKDPPRQPARLLSLVKPRFQSGL